MTLLLGMMSAEGRIDEAAIRLMAERGFSGVMLHSGDRKICSM